MTGAIKKRIRTALKYAAYRLFSLRRILKRFPRIDSSYGISKIEDKHRETFFGYYDKFPENGTGVLLFHSALKTSVHPAKQHSVDIVASGPGVEKRFSTRAFNWQQGSRLQWINDSEFIFNDYDPAGKRYICRRCSIDNDSERVYPWPVQDAFQDEYMISIDYHVLSRYASDYGYFCEVDDISEQSAIIRKVDFNGGKDQILVKGEEVLALLGLDKNKVFHYYFNHGMISPDGSKFIFMFRYSDSRK